MFLTFGLNELDIEAQNIYSNLPQHASDYFQIKNLSRNSNSHEAQITNLLLLKMIDDNS